MNVRHHLPFCFCVVVAICAAAQDFEVIFNPLDWRKEPPRSTTATIPFQEFTAIVEVDLRQRLNQYAWCAVELSDSGRSIQVKQYQAVVDRETNDFPKDFSASLDFHAWASPDKREGELLGSVKGQIHFDPADSQTPIRATKISRTVAGPGRVFFLYEWQIKIPLIRTVREIPPLLEGTGTCNCGSYEDNASPTYQDTLLLYTIRGFGRSPNNPAPRSALAITKSTLLPTNSPGKIQLSISKDGPTLRVTCSPVAGAKVLERTRFDQAWKWEPIDRTTNETLNWYVLPKNQGESFRVRLE